jgi:ornithine cyclodeaminase/alanine dehydrogenase-like protein (mu-crystallin family)
MEANALIKKGVRTMRMIGCGAQNEFQAIAFSPSATLMSYEFSTLRKRQLIKWQEI